MQTDPEMGSPAVATPPLPPTIEGYSEVPNYSTSLGLHVHGKVYSILVLLYVHADVYVFVGFSALHRNSVYIHVHIHVRTYMYIRYGSLKKFPFSVYLKSLFSCSNEHETPFNGKINCPFNAACFCVFRIKAKNNLSWSTSH